MVRIQGVDVLFWYLRIRNINLIHLIVTYSANKTRNICQLIPPVKNTTYIAARTINMGATILINKSKKILMSSSYCCSALQRPHLTCRNKNTNGNIVESTSHFSEIVGSLQLVQFKFNFKPRS